MERNCFFQVKSVINQAFGDKITLLSSVDELFSTGYSTHGLFAYRGKFHSQLIKGLLNILGVAISRRYK